MMPEVESHHHPHPTGHRRLDLILPISALFVSVVSLVLAVIHGKAMERMADANARLVQANSWPFLQYETGNVDEKGDLVIGLNIHNAGVGPAKIESFEVSWNGRPVRSSVDLLEQCCGLEPTKLAAVAQAPAKGATLEAKVVAAKKAAQSSIKSGYGGVGASGVLEAHQEVAFLSLPLTAKTEPIWIKLNSARFKLNLRACYCSVFDECWISNLQTMKPTPVKVCPVPKVPYGT